MTPAGLMFAVTFGFGVFSFWMGFIAGKLQRLIEAVDRNADAVDDFRIAFNTHANGGCQLSPPCCSSPGRNKRIGLLSPCNCECHE